MAVDPTQTHRDATVYGAIAAADGHVADSCAAGPRSKDRTVHSGPLRERTLGFTQTGLMLLMAGALVFLMIGCANLANLLLARALARDREIP